MHLLIALLLAAIAFATSVNTQTGCTVISTVYVTNVVTETVLIISIAQAASSGTTQATANSSNISTGKLYTGLGLDGWNATTVKNLSTAASTFKLTSSLVSPSAVGSLNKRYDRNVVITATINGKVVSWKADPESLFATPTSSALAGAELSSPIPHINEQGFTYRFHTSILSSERDAAVQTPSADAEIPSTSSISIVESSKVYSSPSTASTSPQAALSSPCNEDPEALFVNFDDLPHFTVSDDPDDQDIPPIFNPYRKLYFDNHFGYVPPPSDPYLPRSSPQLAVYRASGTAADGSPDAGLVAGGIGAGPRAADDTYWFNPQSAYFGCSDGSPSMCLLTVNVTFGGAQTESTTQSALLPPCPGLNHCSLQYVKFDSALVGVSNIAISAAIGNKAVDYYMDDLSIVWYNSSCTAQLERASSE